MADNEFQINIPLPPPKRSDKIDNVWGVPLPSSLKEDLKEIHGTVTDVNEYLRRCMEQLCRATKIQRDSYLK